MDPSRENIEKWHNDPTYWKWGLFYFNRDDNRIFVDKRPAWAGVTFNFANPKTYLVILICMGFFGGIIYMIERNGR